MGRKQDKFYEQLVDWYMRPRAPPKAVKSFGNPAGVGRPLVGIYQAVMPAGWAYWGETRPATQS